MEDSDAQWIKGNISDVAETPAEFDVELWMSTDGKHSVKVMPKNAASRKAAFTYAQELFDRLMIRYGSKQAHAVEEYKAAESGLGKCPKCGAPMKMSSKGKPYCEALCWKKG